MLRRTLGRAAVVAALAVVGLWAAQAAPQDADEVILFDVLVPADAVVELQGVKTSPTGPIRHFQTPPLKVGGDYTYKVAATHGGKTVERELHLKHGQTNTLDLRAEFPTAAPARTTIASKPTPRGGVPVERPKTYAKDEAAIAKNAEAFVEAFHKGDAKALAAFWAADGDYTEQTGRQLKGRDAIETAFRKFFADNKGLKVGIDSLDLRFVSPDVAVEEGTSEVFTPDGAPPSRARFTNVHVKKDGQWMLSSVRDAPYSPPSNYEHLRGLEWAVGDWIGEGEAGAVERLSVSWSENQNFLHATFSTTVKGISVGSANQWVVWDPIAKRIRSYIFDATGGFGEGTWNQDGKTWTIKTTSVLQDGRPATATLVLAPIDADTITLQAKNRTVGGAKLPDTKVTKLKRVK